MIERKAIRFSVVTFEPVSSDLIENIALNSFETIKPYMQSDKLTTPLVSWTLPWQKGRTTSLHHTDWESLRRLEVEKLTITAGDKECFRFQYYYAVNDWPTTFNWLIDSELWGNQVTQSLQEAIVSITKRVFVSTNACTGYISYDNNPNSDFFSSPYERLIRGAPGLNMPHCRSRTQGYYWGIFLTNNHLNQIGGLNRLNEIPIYYIESLHNGYYMQLSEKMTQIPQAILQAVADLFAPILPHAKPGIAPLTPNPYQFILDVPWQAFPDDSQSNSVTDNELPVFGTSADYNGNDFTHLLESTQNPLEASEWLANNLNPYPLASNRFGSREAAQQFVESLYEAGAKAVYITFIHNEPRRVEQEGGPYAESLLVKLPHEPKARTKILTMAEEEMRHEGFLEDEEQLEIRGDEESISFWWD
jgi:hypothetical protein